MRSVVILTIDGYDKICSEVKNLPFRLNVNDILCTSFLRRNLIDYEDEFIDELIENTQSVSVKAVEIVDFSEEENYVENKIQIWYSLQIHQH